MSSATASVSSSAINLINTIIGAGLLAIPYSFKTDGIALGSFLLSVSAITAGFGLYLQNLSSKFVSAGNSNFFNICSITYPKLSVLFDVAIAIQCFGVGLSYLILTGDLMPIVIPLSGWDHNSMRTLYILLSAFITIPLCFLKKLDSLKYTSIISLLAIAYLVLLVYGNFIYDLSTDFSNISRGEILVWQNEGIFKIFSTFSIGVFAFTGHQNMYSIINELANPTIGRVNLIISMAMVCSFVLFYSVGLLGYLNFGDLVQGNIILSYNDYPLVRLGRLLLILMVLLSFPLMFHPARISINNIYYYLTSGDTSSTVETEIPDENTELLRPVRTTNSNSQVLKTFEVPLSHSLFVKLTISMLIVSYFIAITLKSFQLVLALVGATGSTSISFILPGLFGYKLINSNTPEIIEKFSEFNSESYLDSRIFNSKLLKNLCLTLSVFGFCVMLICIYSSLV